jgi:hypothetical protein
VARLAAETPASFVAFDLLALDDEAQLDVPQGERRARLEQALAGATAPVHLTPATDDAALAREWFTLFEGAGLDGVVAKPVDAPYSPDKRVMQKVKHARTADCVVAGFRWHKSGPVVGSLVLGLHDDHGVLQHVGVAAAFPMTRRKELVAELEPYRAGEGDPHPWTGEAMSERAPTSSAGSRWNRDKDLSFVPLRPELVVEVAYDHMEGARFRHTAPAAPLPPRPRPGVVQLPAARAPGPLRPRGGAVRAEPGVSATLVVDDVTVVRGPTLVLSGVSLTVAPRSGSAWSVRTAPGSRPCCRCSPATCSPTAARCTSRRGRRPWGCSRRSRTAAPVRC